MGLIDAIVPLTLAAVPIVLLSAWFVGRGDRGLESLTAGSSAGGWWRSTMPLPHGVQEAVEVHWHFADREPLPGAPAEPPEDAQPAIEPGTAGVEVARTRLRPHTRIR